MHPLQQRSGGWYGRNCPGQSSSFTPIQEREEHRFRPGGMASQYANIPADASNKTGRNICNKYASLKLRIKGSSSMLRYRGCSTARSGDGFF
jgi:hypothetical protein